MKNKFQIIFLTLILSTPTSIYTIHFTKIGSDEINMGSFAGKKIVVAAINSARPNYFLIKYLDSLSRAANSIAVIAIPGKEFDSTVSESALAHLHDSLQLNMIFGEPGYLKKNSAQRQHPLFSWLTHKDQNGHFDRDVEEDGQLFVISETGTLYAVFDGRASKNIINQAIQRQVRE